MSCDCDDVQLLGAQVLGIRGDVAYDESGDTELAIAQLEVEVAFLYEKAVTDYRFEYLYITDEGGTPQDIRAVVMSQSTTGFVVQLSGAPVTAVCILHWHVMKPDRLEVPSVPGPIAVYGLIRPHQQGVTALVSGQDYINVTFPDTQADDDWVFESLTIENQTDPAQASQIFSWTVAQRTSTGFRLDLSGTPDNSSYVLRWKVA